MVDDNRDFLDVAREFIGAHEAMEVQTASTAREALKTLEQHKADLLITDVAMPDTNGFELTRAVKELYPTLPVIVLSMMDSQHSRAAAEAAGADAFVSKAAMDDDLIPAIERLSRSLNTH